MLHKALEVSKMFSKARSKINIVNHSPSNLADLNHLGPNEPAQTLLVLIRPAQTLLKRRRPSSGPIGAPEARGPCSLYIYIYIYIVGPFGAIFERNFILTFFMRKLFKHTAKKIFDKLEKISCKNIQNSNQIRDFSTKHRHFFDILLRLQRKMKKILDF